MLASGTQLGRYEIAAPLGTGGMGEVYRATDSRLNRQVAIKVLASQFVQDQARLARFEREAKVVASLSHPNILGIHDFATEQGQTFAVMELLEGETLRQRIAHGAIPPRRAVEIAVAIADGLAAAHAKGIVHRDLKPENLFLTADGQVKILDFGLARIESRASSADTPTASNYMAQTEEGAILGTVGYMSPEQVRGRVADGRSDVFSLGCVLYEMVSGHRPFIRETAAETMTAILHDEPPDLADSVKHVPMELEGLIRHCVEKNREARFQSAADLAFALRAILRDSGPAQAAPAAAPPRPRSIIWIGAALVCVGILGVSLYPRTSGNKIPEPSKPIQAIAILPFVNESNDPETEPISEGIAESIIKSLYEVRDLKVRPFSSVARYKGSGKDLDLQDVARKLNVQAVLIGRLTQRKEGLTLSVELVDVRELDGLWSAQFDPGGTDIQAIQEEIAQRICAKLGLHLTGDEQERLTKRYTANTEAYQLYLKGRYFWNKRTREGLTTGIEHFEQAIEKDPSYALAYAGLADCHIILGWSGFGPPEEAFSKARRAATAAVKLDGALAEGHTSLASVLIGYDWNYSEADREFRRAIELNPNSANAHDWYSMALISMGRHDEALREAKRALELEPLSLPIIYHHGWPYFYSRQYDKAIVQFQNVLALDPNFGWGHEYLGRAYLHKGMTTEAIAALQQAIALSKGSPRGLGLLGFAHAHTGNEAEARKVLDELVEVSQHRYVSPYDIAIIHMGLANNDQAFEYLERAYHERSGRLRYLRQEPMFDGLRADARYHDLLRRIGLADNG